MVGSAESASSSPASRRSDHSKFLAELADKLEAGGYEHDEAEELRELQDELDALDQPPGLVRKVSDQARFTAKRQWGLFVGELQESKEAMGLIATKVKGERDLTQVERDKVRAQIGDMMKMVPAGLIAAVNTALPVPFTSFFTPWLLLKMGLMPSRWREAHLIDRLRRQRDRLRSTGHLDEASQVESLLEQLEHEADEREEICKSAALLTHWDKNENGIWDDEEKAAYRAELEKLRHLARRSKARKRWFLDHDGEVFGAVRLTEVNETSGTENLLVCYDGKTGWVALTHLMGEEPEFK